MPGVVALGIEGISDGEAIGSGGNAVVYRALETAHDRWVAVKVMRGADEDTRRRFDRERRAMGRLSGHDGIVTIHSSGFTAANDPYLVMGLYEHGSLQDQVDASGPMPWRVACEHMVQVSDTLHYAHERSVLHRDMKPSNILVSASGRPAIADFGISRLTEAGASVGSVALTFTPSYCPPEVLEGAEPSVSADVYGLAATLFALVAGAAPFATRDDESIFSVMRRVAADPVPDLRASGVPDAVCRVMERAMAKDPSQRHVSAAALAADLRSILAGEPPSAAPAMAAPTVEHQATEDPTVPGTGAVIPPPTAQPQTIGQQGPLPAPTPTPAARASSSRSPMLALMAGLLALGGGIVAVAIILLSGDSPPEETAEQITTDPGVQDGDSDPATDAAADDGADETTEGTDQAEGASDDATADGTAASSSPNADGVADIEVPSPEVPEVTPPVFDGPLVAPELTLGTVLPETGPLAFIGESLVVAVELAVADINAAGGQVTLNREDSATDRDVVTAAVDTHRGAGVHGVVGPAASSTTIAFVDAIAAAEVAGCSPTASADGLGVVGDDGYFFRTAPPQALINRALASLVAGDGARTAAILHGESTFDTNAVESFVAAFEAGGGQVVATETTTFDQTSFSEVVARVRAAGPDAVVVMGVAAGASVIREMVSVGYGPSEVMLYVSEDLGSASLAGEIGGGAGVAAGIRGVQTAAAPESAATFFPDALAERAPGVTSTFAAHAYDCAIVFGLAALQAQSAEPADWIALVPGITRGGAVCTTYANCAALLDQGQDIDYDGASGPLDFIDAGEPSVGVFDVFEIAPDGLLSLRQQITTRR